MLTTFISFDFFRAWELYTRRWSLEVVIKEYKQHLVLVNDKVPILFTSLPTQPSAPSDLTSFLSQTLLYYETIGGLFREVNKETVQLSLAQQIWGYFQEIVSEMAQLFGLLDEEIYEVVINKSEQLTHICEFSI